MADTRFEKWLEELNVERKKYWDANFTYKPYPELTYSKGRKFIKIVGDGSVWGFVSMYDGEFKGRPVHKGDLLKAASYNSPAKHSRGNIFNGTAAYQYYGPTYLK